MAGEKSTPLHTAEREKIGWGNRLKAARKDAGLTQQEVSKALADAEIIPEDRYQTVSEWEREERQPRAAELTWLGERYGVEVDWILSGRDAEAEAAAFRRSAAIVDEVRLGEDVKNLGEPPPPGGSGGHGDGEDEVA